MRSPAEVATAFGRSSDLLDQVDYRLAQTPEEKEEIYNLRYRAYLREDRHDSGGCRSLLFLRVFAPDDSRLDPTGPNSAQRPSQLRPGTSCCTPNANKQLLRANRRLTAC